MKFKLIVLILILIQFCCKKTTNNPASAQIISGRYQANTYNNGGSPNILYPINGQTITLQIDPVSDDSVSVQVNSTINGSYSPGGNAVYPNTAVHETICSNCQYDKTYSISLGSQLNPGTLENTIWFDPNNNAYYTYIPPNYTKGTVQTIFVKTK